MKLFFAFLVIIFCIASSDAEERRVVDPYDIVQIVPANGALKSYATVRIYGPIDDELYQAIASRLNGFQGVVFVNLQSGGGDVASALKIGRIIRNHRASVNVPDGVCASACVFIYAAGASRFALPKRLVIHRPYLSGKSSAGQASVENQYVEMRRQVRSYLEEMNVSPELYDAMQSIPPSEQHALSDAEAVRYGLIALDPVEDELRVDDSSQRTGLSREEVRKRAALIHNTCDSMSAGEEQFACAARVRKGQGWD